jgi:hypothetical protein
MISIMKAELLIRRRVGHASGGFAEIVIWRVPSPIMGSEHAFKYRLAFVYEGVCVLRYDNELGKGDHKHLGETELRYEFRGTDRLLQDFAADIRRWCDENGHL